MTWGPWWDSDALFIFFSFDWDNKYEVLYIRHWLIFDWIAGIFHHKKENIINETKIVDDNNNVMPCHPQNLWSKIEMQNIRNGYFRLKCESKPTNICAHFSKWTQKKNSQKSKICNESNWEIYTLKATRKHTMGWYEREYVGNSFSMSHRSSFYSRAQFFFVFVL